MLSAAPLLVAAVCSFAGPSGHLAAPLARPLAAAAVPTVYMAGWNDPFSSAGGSNREKMEVKSTGSSFEEKMAEDQKAMSNMMLGGSAAMIAAILVILIPLLATQPDA